MRRPLLIACALALFPAALPGLRAARADEPAKLTARQKGDLAIKARAVLHKYCAACHHGGEDTRGRLAVKAGGGLTPTPAPPVPFVAPGNPDGSQVIQFIADGSMPPGKHPRPTRKDVDVLRDWIAAGAPGYPDAFDDEATTRTLVNELRATKSDDARNLRYVSLAHLVGDDADTAAIDRAHDHLEKALESVAGPDGRGVLQPVDGTATLLRFDLRKLGWDGGTLFRVEHQFPRGRLSPLSAHDLLLLEYPLASAPPDDAVLNDYVGNNARLVRPIPFLRGDWLAEALLPRSSPGPSLLAPDLQSLSKLRAGLKKQGDPQKEDRDSLPCGTTSRPFGGLGSPPPAPKPEGQRPVLPLASWYFGDVRPEKGPDFDVSVVEWRKPAVVLGPMKPGQPFQFQVRTEEPVYFALVWVTGDGLATVVDTQQAGFLAASGPVTQKFTVPTSEKPAFLAPGVPSPKTSVTDYYVFLASPTPLPPVVVVKSRHATAKCDGRVPVTRFHFDMTSAKRDFDPARVARRVVPVTATVPR